jgi:hypothetical protein
MVSSVRPDMNTDRHELPPHMSRERIRTAREGHAFHADGGGARAWAFDPTRMAGFETAASSQDMRWYWR